MASGNDDNKELDLFDLAFGEAVAGTTTEPPATDPPAADPPAADPPATDPPAADPPATEPPAADPPAADPPATDPPAADPPAPNPLEAELAKLRAENEKLKATPPAPAAPTAEEKAAEEARKAAAEKSNAEWEAFKKDWAEPAAMMEKMYAGIMASVPQMIQAAIAEAISPIQQQTALTAEERFKADVTAKHADAFEVIADGSVDKWIETLPSFQRAAATAVLDKGSAKEVVELLDLFRGTTPAAATPPAKTAEEIAAEQKAEAEKKRKLAAMQTVPDKRSTTTGQPDPNDFDSAFKQAVASGL